MGFITEDMLDPVSGSSGSGNYVTPDQLDQPTWGSEAQAVGGRFMKGISDLADLGSSITPDAIASRLSSSLSGGPDVNAILAGRAHEALQSDAKDYLGLDTQAQPKSEPGKIAGEIAYVAPSFFLPGLGEAGVAARGLEAAASGVAGQFGKEVGGDTGELIGMGAPSLLLGLGRGALRAGFTPEEKAAQDAKSIVQSFLGPSEPQAVQAISDFNAGRGTPAMIDPTLMRTAEVSGNPGLKALEESVRKSKEFVPTEVAIQAQDAEREAARQDLFQSLEPNKRYGGSSIADLTPDERAAEMRQAAEANREALHDSAKLDYEKAFAGDEQLRTFPAKRAVSDALSTFMSTGARVPAGDFMDLVDRFRALPPKAPLQTLHDFASAFGEHANVPRTADTVTQQTGRVAAAMQQAVQGTIDRAVASGALPEAQADAYRSAQAKWSTMKNTFDRGVVGKMLASDRGGYTMDAATAAQAGLKSPEKAQALGEALGPNIAGQSAKRGQFLSDLWEGSIERGPNGENVFKPGTFDTKLRKLQNVAAETLTPKQQEAMARINLDLQSQAGVRSGAYAASKGGPFTAQGLNLIDLIQGAVEKKGISRLAQHAPVMGDFLATMLDMVKGTAKQKRLINGAIADMVMNPKFAEELMKTNPPPAVITRMTTEFAKTLSRVAPALLALASEGETGKTVSASLPPLLTEARAESGPVSLSGSGSVFSPEQGQTVFGRVLDSIRQVESSGGKNLLSKAGAKGPYQLMDKTGLTVFHRLQQSGDLPASAEYDPFDEDQARQIASYILTENLNHPGIDGDIVKALTAYHSGPSAAVTGKLGPEGKAYAPKVAKAFQLLAGGNA